MAGSYSHLEKDNGTFTFDNIENLGDAYEACEMCFWMIHYLTTSKNEIKEAEDAYYEYQRRKNEEGIQDTLQPRYQ